MSKVEVIRANSILVNRKRGKEIKRLRVADYCRVSTRPGRSVKQL